MKIIIDANGGDYAPLEVLKGITEAKKEKQFDVVLTGRTETIKNVAQENSIDISSFEIIDCDDVISMDCEPAEITKSMKNSSMAVGLRALADGKGDAFLSGGNTGALLFGATMYVKRIKGIKRAALAPLLPTNDGMMMLIDAGANTSVKSEYLLQFAVMGDIYMRNIMSVEKPRVALVNIGEEEHKGDDLRRETYALLKESNLNFIGNIEGRDIMCGKADVIVTDGFSGNLILKTIEGVVHELMKNIKNILLGKTISKIVTALFFKKGLYAFKKKMDYKEYGGSMFMGISKPVIKAHGSSDAKAFKNAIFQAIHIVESGVISQIEENINKA